MLSRSADRVLVCLRYGIGDVVMELPVLHALRRWLPHARITALGAEPAVELVAMGPRIDDVVSIRRWGLRHRWDAGTPEIRAAVGGWARGRAFDVMLDVSHAATAVSHAIWATGVRTLEADAAAERAALESGVGGVAAIGAAVRRGWGLPVPQEPPRLRVPGPARRWARSILGHGDSGNGEAPPILALGPVGSNPLKRWPHERFAALADRWREVTGGPALVFRGPDLVAGEEIRRAARHPDALREVGALPLTQIAALLERCAVAVSNDTGVMHMAAALGTATVGVFGPTRAEVFLPAVEHAVAASPDGLACPHRATQSLRPPRCCFDGSCLIGPESCIRGISVDDVWARVLALHETPALEPSGAMLAAEA